MSATRLEDLNPALLADILRRLPARADLHAARRAARLFDGAARGALTAVTLQPRTLEDAFTRGGTASLDWRRFPQLRRLRLEGWELARASEAGSYSSRRARDLHADFYFTCVENWLHQLRSCFKATGPAAAAQAAAVAGAAAAAAEPPPLAGVTQLDLGNSKLDPGSLDLILSALPGLASLKLLAASPVNFNPFGGSDASSDAGSDDGGGFDFFGGSDESRFTRISGPAISPDQADEAAAAARNGQLSAIAAHAPRLAALSVRNMCVDAAAAAALGALGALTSLEVQDLDYSDVSELLPDIYFDADPEVRAFAGADGVDPAAASTAAPAALVALPRRRLRALALARLPRASLGGLGLGTLTRLGSATASVYLPQAYVPALAADLPALRALAACPAGEWGPAACDLAAASFPLVTHASFLRFSAAPPPAATFSRGARLAVLLPALRSLTLDAEGAPPPSLAGLTGLTELDMGAAAAPLARAAWRAVLAMPLLRRLRACAAPRDLARLREATTGGRLGALTSLELRVEAAAAAFGGRSRTGGSEAEGGGVAGLPQEQQQQQVGEGSDDLAGEEEDAMEEQEEEGRPAFKWDLWDVLLAACSLPALRVLGVAAPPASSRRGGHWGPDRDPVTACLGPLARCAAPLQSLVLRAPALSSLEATHLPQLLGNSGASAGGLRLRCLVVSHYRGDASTWASVFKAMEAHGVVLSHEEEAADAVMQHGSWRNAVAAEADAAGGFGAWWRCVGVPEPDEGGSHN
jgi:hypothetical protein